MRNVILILAALASFAIAQPQAVTHSQFQAVSSTGDTAFVGSDVVVLEGIILNNPEDNLSPEPNSLVAPGFIGGQWQIFVQGEGADTAGTACWLGQNYANRGYPASYSNEDFLNELYRLNYDEQTGYLLRAGDRVRITGGYLFFGGKLNINEQHQTDDEFDFTVELLKAAVGLPSPEEITLADIKDEYNDFIFDQTRQTGGERYQARRVRIEGVTVTNPQNWAPGAMLEIEDASGRNFDVKLGLGKGISLYDCPTGEIDVIGIFNQEAGIPGSDYRKGYELLVLDHNGNPLVLGDTGALRGNLAGDVNGDGKVDLVDFAILASDWLSSVAGLE